MKVPQNYNTLVLQRYRQESGGKHCTPRHIHKRDTDLQSRKNLHVNIQGTMMRNTQKRETIKIPIKDGWIHQVPPIHTMDYSLAVET